MWEADFSAPALSDQSIALERLLDLGFYFRDKGHYLVNINRGEPDGAANGSQPIRSETNSTSSAAGSRR